MISLFHEPKQMGLVLGTSFKGKQVWIPPIPKQMEEMWDLKQIIKKLKAKNSKEQPTRNNDGLGIYEQIWDCEDKEPLFDLKNHQTDLKIDGMFFSCTDDKLSVLGEEFQVKKGSLAHNSSVFDKITEQEEVSLDEKRYDLL